MRNWTAADLPDLSGRTVVVTGASSGIGMVTARESARAGARVVLAVRDVHKGQQAARDIVGDTEVRRLDVADLASVREFARTWSGDLNILINNAGIMELPLTRTADGFEAQAATNYFGPFALTNLLLPHITDRVVTLSSQLHRRGRLRLDDLNWERRPYDASAAYCDSKLYATLFALELDRRLASSAGRVRSVLAHPGIAATNLVSHVDGVRGLAYRLTRFAMNTADEGARPTLFAATADLPGGAYVGPDGLTGLVGRHPRIGAPSATAADPMAARELWAVTAALTGVETPPVP